MLKVELHARSIFWVWSLAGSVPWVIEVKWLKFGNRNHHLFFSWFGWKFNWGCYPLPLLACKAHGKDGVAGKEAEGMVDYLVGIASLFNVGFGLFMEKASRGCMLCGSVGALLIHLTLTFGGH